jgi:hypothetical protein
MKRVLRLTAVVFALFGVMQAQNAVTVGAPTGSVNPQSTGTLHFTGGGDATVAANLSSCYFNNNPSAPCYFSSGRVSYYNMPRNPNATLTTFVGKLQPLGGNVYTVTGAASGFDAAGDQVHVSKVQFTFTVFCRSGRGGGCVRTYKSGAMTYAVTP